MEIASVAASGLPPPLPRPTPIRRRISHASDKETQSYDAEYLAAELMDDADDG